MSLFSVVLWFLLSFIYSKPLKHLVFPGEKCIFPLYELALLMGSGFSSCVNCFWNHQQWDVAISATPALSTRHRGHTDLSSHEMDVSAYFFILQNTNLPKFTWNNKTFLNMDITSCLPLRSMHMFVNRFLKTFYHKLDIMIILIFMLKAILIFMLKALHNVK